MTSSDQVCRQYQSSCVPRKWPRGRVVGGVSGGRRRRRHRLQFHAVDDLFRCGGRWRSDEGDVTTADSLLPAAGLSRPVDGGLKLSAGRGKARGSGPGTPARGQTGLGGVRRGRLRAVAGSAVSASMRWRHGVLWSAGSSGGSVRPSSAVAGGRCDESPKEFRGFGTGREEEEVLGFPQDGDRVDRGATPG